MLQLLVLLSARLLVWRRNVPLSLPRVVLDLLLKPSQMGL